MATTKKTSSKSKKKVAQKVVKKNGRPTLFNADLADKICTLLSEGSSLLKICKMKGMPVRGTVHRWLLESNEDGTPKNQKFRDNYALAQEMRADYAFDEINEIADQTPDLIKKTAEKKSGAMANAQRLRVDARKWTAARMFPKKYSERHVVSTEDKDGNIVPITGNIIQFAPQNKDS